jgi:hypothetical protein
MRKDLFRRERVVFAVSAVSVQAADDYEVIRCASIEPEMVGLTVPSFFLGKELGCVWKVHNEKPANDSSDHRHNAKHNENPAPALQSAKTAHASKAVSQDRRKPRCQN